MSAYYGTARRAGGSSAIGSMTWAPNRNSVRHNAKISLGPFGRIGIFVALVVIIGLFSVAQSASVTSYDMAIANIDSEITNLEAQRDALAVENAKMTAAAATEEGNEAASTMVVASAADFVTE